MLNLNLNPFQQQAKSMGAGQKFGAAQSPFAGAGKPSSQAIPGQDQLGAFKAEIQSGKINPNVNAPAPLYTATRSWSA
jgi:hypothetical protein